MLDFLPLARDVAAGIGLPWLATMDLAAQLLRRQPYLIRFGAIGAVRPHIAARVIRRHDLAEHPAIAVGRRRHGDLRIKP